MNLLMIEIGGIKDYLEFMGYILNPGNDAFRKIRNVECVDHSMLIEQLNRTFFTTDGQICFCKPHGFGKTYDARRTALLFSVQKAMEDSLRSMKLSDIVNDTENRIEKKDSELISNP